jgi:hypothetical protein
MADKPGFNEDAEGFWIAKDPSAIKDYTLDFTKWLVDGDVIDTVVWTVPADVIKVDEGIRPGNLKAWVKIGGGDLGKNYMITAHVVTAQAREDDKSFRLVIRES